jgi:hypothetical protein
MTEEEWYECEQCGLTTLAKREEVVGTLLAETIGELSRRPTMEQYAIVVGERDRLAEKVNELEEVGYFW